MYVGEFTATADTTFSAENYWIYEKDKDTPMVEFLANPYDTGSALPPSTGASEIKTGVTYTVYEFTRSIHFYISEVIGNDLVAMHLAENLSAFPVDIPEYEVHTFKLVTVDGNAPKETYAAAVFLDSLGMMDTALAMSYGAGGTRVT